MARPYAGLRLLVRPSAACAPPCMCFPVHVLPEPPPVEGPLPFFGLSTIRRHRRHRLPPAARRTLCLRPSVHPPAFWKPCAPSSFGLPCAGRRCRRYRRCRRAAAPPPRRPQGRARFARRFPQPRPNFLSSFRRHSRRNAPQGRRPPASARRRRQGRARPRRRRRPRMGIATQSHLY